MQVFIYWISKTITASFCASSLPVLMNIGGLCIPLDHVIIAFKHRVQGRSFLILTEVIAL